MDQLTQNYADYIEELALAAEAERQGISHAALVMQLNQRDWLRAELQRQAQYVPAPPKPSPPVQAPVRPVQPPMNQGIPFITLCAWALGIGIGVASHGLFLLLLIPWGIWRGLKNLFK